jgi:uncharacterized protein YfaS (alpha-2-macroglobulin family)
VANWLAMNREHGSYWKSTRDTAQAVAAISEYLKLAKADLKPSTVTVSFDGKSYKTKTIDPTSLSVTSEVWSIPVPATTTGKRDITVRRKGRGQLFCSASMKYFSTEDPIPSSGSLLKVSRKYYKLTGKKDKSNRPVKVELKPKEAIPSSQLLEVELTIEATDDFEYLLLEDMKPAGCEATEALSGYQWVNDLSVYREFRIDRVCFYIEKLPKGKHVLRYRTRAETPGTYSALPARIEDMYDPKISGNSDEAKIRIEERK